MFKTGFRMAAIIEYAKSFLDVFKYYFALLVFFYFIAVFVLMFATIICKHC